MHLWTGTILQCLIISDINVSRSVTLLFPTFSPFFPSSSGGGMNHDVTCRLHAQLTDSISPNPERSAAKWAPPPSTQSSRTPNCCFGREEIPSLNMVFMFVMCGYNEFSFVNKAVILWSVMFEPAVLVANSSHNCCVATTIKHGASFNINTTNKCVRTGGE